MPKKCPKGKILNEVSGRCVNINGIIGLKIIKQKTQKKFKVIIKDKKTKKPKKTQKKFKVIIKDPIDIKYNFCDKGLVSENKININISSYLEKIGEFNDVYCVSKGLKKLSGLDFSSYGKDKFRKSFNKDLINKVIDYCNYKNVHYLHNKKKGGMYLKSIFFLPKNINSALKLMYILWVPNSLFKQIETQIAIGLLFGYKEQNIIYFCRDKLGEYITNIHIKDVKNKISKLKITLVELQKANNIVYKTNIDNI